MKIKYFFFLAILISFTNVHANTNLLSSKFIPLKDFIILKFDLFIQSNINNLVSGGGVVAVSYQSVKYSLNIDKMDNIFITVSAVMNEKRYSSKKYYPKLKDCIQIRNKIFINKYGYSPFKQTFNNLVNEEILINKINDNILNISILDEDLKSEILDKTKIKINIIHPKTERNISCSGKLIDTKLY
jgi:hypothetical protein|tara:strand:- start:487 stop:1044 length:558 start_codon:yes stop_codon:yes gene_type:complete